MTKKEETPEVFIPVITFTCEEGAYCLTEYQLPEATLKKYGKKAFRSEPDIFGVFMNVLTKKAREILGI